MRACVVRECINILMNQVRRVFGMQSIQTLEFSMQTRFVYNILYTITMSVGCTIENIDWQRRINMQQTLWLLASISWKLVAPCPLNILLATSNPCPFCWLIWVPSFSYEYSLETHINSIQGVKMLLLWYHSQKIEMELRLKFAKNSL